MGFRGRSVPLLAAVFVVLAGAAAEAGTVKVGRLQSDCPGGCDYYDFDDLNTKPGFGIKSAMDHPQTVSGDTVLVWRGSRTANGTPDYTGDITMKSGVRLVAFGYPDSVPVISRAAGGVAAITMSLCSEVTEISGFIITWDALASGLGGGIAAYTSDGIIKNNRFVDCKAGIGAGIYLQSCTATVTNNLFLNNACAAGGGVIAISGGSPLIENNSIVGASTPIGYDGAAVYATGSSFELRNNIIYGSLGASAVYCGASNTPTIACNMFWANQLGAFGGGCPDSVGTSGNVYTDPLFCNVSMQQFGLCSDSPALSGSCGSIGYVSPFGGCASCQPTSVSASLMEASWGQVKAGYRR